MICYAAGIHSQPTVMWILQARNNPLKSMARPIQKKQQLDESELKAANVSVGMATV